MSKAIVLAGAVALATWTGPLYAGQESQDLKSVQAPVATSNHTVSVRQLRIPAKAAREFSAGQKLRTTEPDKAIGHFQRAIHDYPSYTDAYVQMGLARMDKREWEAAEAALRQAIAGDPNSPEANTALGILLNRRGQFSQSAPVLRRAVQLDPQSASAHYELGLSCWELRAYDDAAREAQASVDLDPDFAGSRVLLGTALLRNNHSAAAAEQFQRALLLDPHGPLSEATRNMLDKLAAANQVTNQRP